MAGGVQAAQTPAEPTPIPEPRALLKEIRSRGAEAQPALFQQLAGWASKEALDDLCDAVDSLPNGYRYASPALLSFTAFRGLDGLEPRAIAFLYERSGRTTGYPVQAVTALAQFGEPAMPQLLDLLRKSQSMVIRGIALRPLLDLLAANGNEEGLELILRNYAGDSTCPPERLTEVLATFPPEVSLPLFAASMRDETLRRDVRRAAVEAAVHIPGAAAEDFLRGCLVRRADDWLQLAGLRALRARGSVAHGREVERLLRAADPVLRFTAFLEEARLREGDPDWEKEVMKRVRSRSVLERQAAAATLAYLPRSRAFDPLMQLLDDADYAVRSMALQSIEALRWYPTLAPLIERLEHETPVMRAKVHRTLVALTGLPMPASPRMWRAWWGGEGARFRLPSAEDAAAQLAAFEATRVEDGAGRTVASFFGVPVVSSRVVFIVDTSGSMQAPYQVQGRYAADGMTGTRLSVAKAQLLGAIDALSDDDRFNVMFFETGFQLWSDGMTKISSKSRKSVQGFVDSQTPRGGTGLYEALERVFLDFEMDIDTIYLLSDGQPNGGAAGVEKTRESVKEWNQLRQITMHCVSLGGTVQLLQDLAEMTGGEFREVR